MATMTGRLSLEVPHIVLITNSRFRSVAVAHVCVFVVSVLTVMSTVVNLSLIPMNL